MTSKRQNCIGKIITVSGNPVYIFFDYSYEKKVPRYKGSSGVSYIFCSWCLEEKSMVRLKKIKETIPNKAVIAANTEEEAQLCRKFGFDALFMNHNAFVNENIFTITNQPKKYDLVINSAFTPWKRVHLAEAVPNVVDIGYPKAERQYPDWEKNIPQFGESPNFPRGEPRNKKSYRKLSYKEVADMLNQSRVGGIFSEKEGANFASIEYMLCGLPVLSTPSKGGRDVFFNQYNSLIVRPDKKSVDEGVRKLLGKKLDPETIRSGALAQMDLFRTAFARDIAARLNMDDVGAVAIKKIKEDICN